MEPLQRAQAHLRIPGLVLRPFEGEKDYDVMGKVIAKSWDADRVEWTITADDYRVWDREPINQDPHRDRLMALIDGKMVGFGEIKWDQLTDGPWLYKHQAYVVPEVRHTGLRRGLLEWNENRLREIAALHPTGVTKMFETWANDEENDWKSLVLSEGYLPAHHSLEMVRQDLDDIPDLSLPAGASIRSVGPEDVRAVWELIREAMRDHRNYSEKQYDEAHFQQCLSEPTCDPNLWAVAWAGDRPVGVVRTYINAAENKQYGRRRGHTEGIAVAREWRRKGVASALIAESLRILRRCGMTSATLDVDAQNPSGAVRVYERMDFVTAKSFTFYQKPLH